MGGGTWTTQAYDFSTKTKIDTGTTFAYSDYAKSHRIDEAHEDLRILAEGKPVTRESRDSDEHPESTPIVIAFDVTGSMGGNPAILQRELKGLFGMLIRKDVVSDPQIAIGAYGDTHCDRVPIQFSQFESDNRIDDNLDNVYLEMGGGGNMGETSTALAWYVANHVVTDAWEKRGKRGYMFLIGDECALDITESQAKEFLGDGHGVTAFDAFNALLKKWDTYFLLVNNYASKMQHSQQKYTDMLGSDHVIVLESTESAPAVIAALIGLAEETVDANALSTELAESGFSTDVAVSAANATVGLAGVDSSYGDLGL